MKKIRFAFLCEGSSDYALVEHIERLLVIAGFDEVSNETPDLSILPYPPKKDIKSKIDALNSLNPQIDLLIIHRDADNAGREKRREEIATHSEQAYSVIPLIPVKMLEAWLICDTDKIKIAAGNPACAKDLGIPKPSKIEQIAQPKDLLFSALIKASELKGRKLEKFKKQLSSMRRYLAIELCPDGPQNQLESYTEFVASINSLASTAIEL